MKIVTQINQKQYFIQNTTFRTIRFFISGNYFSRDQFLLKRYTNKWFETSRCEIRDLREQSVLFHIF